MKSASVNSLVIFMKKNVATILGFLIAPLFAAIVFPAIDVVEGDLGLLDAATYGWVLIFYFYTLGVTLIIGLPVYLLLNRFGKVTWWTALLTGLFCGAVMVFIFDSMELAVIAPLGGLSALIFWLIWRLGNKTGNTEKLTT